MVIGLLCNGKKQNNHNSLHCHQSNTLKVPYFHFLAAWISHPEYENIVSQA